jgi:hypothetical protein
MEIFLSSILDKRVVFIRPVVAVEISANRVDRTPLKTINSPWLEKLPPVKMKLLPILTNNFFPCFNSSVLPGVIEKSFALLKTHGPFPSMII